MFGSLFDGQPSFTWSHMKTITNQPSAIPSVRAICNQVGLAIEASVDGGQTWIGVQIERYKVRSSPTVRAYSTCINPAQDAEDYFAELDRRGVKYNRVRV